jgi:methylmalonyl-CoA mutase
MATERLLNDFPPVGAADWEAAIARDLKGGDYRKLLIWRAEDGVEVKPYYRAGDLKGLAALTSLPGEFPFRRGARPSGDWVIREEIDAADAQEANRAACAAVTAGAEGIAFTRLSVRNNAELEAALAGLIEVPVHFQLADDGLIRLLVERLRSQQNGADRSTGCDPLANTEFAAEIVRTAPTGFVPFTISAAAFEENGAAVIEEIGFALASGIDFLAALTECGAAANRAALALEFNFAIGANYFFQIAKLRAFRMLWARAAERFGVSPHASRARMTARTSRWNKTVYDPHVNVLRATTEAMAAIFGGADAVAVAPFDECSKAPDEASRRLARNTQLLLKHEAGLGRVADPGGGSYYIEALTDILAREGWKKMQEIEARGGFRKAQAEGTIAQALRRSLQARETAVQKRRRVLIGTNQFANPAEHALERVDVSCMNGIHRGARGYEDLRLRTESHAADTGRRPRVLLAKFGDARMRTTRANFATSFFACAGFSIAEKRFSNAAAIAAANADLIVLCGADAEYAEAAAKLMPELKALGRATPVIVAGDPPNAEELEAAGIADFVDARSNPVEVLAEWQKRLGIGD